MVNASFLYLKASPTWESVKPYWIYIPESATPAGVERTNEETDEVPNVEVRDIRDEQNNVGLDKTGFALYRHDFADDPYLASDGQCLNMSGYKRTLEKFVREALGAELVRYITGTIRRRSASFPGDTWGSSTGYNQPIQGVHGGSHAPMPWHA